MAAVTVFFLGNESTVDTLRQVVVAECDKPSMMFRELDLERYFPFNMVFYNYLGVNYRSSKIQW